MIIHGCPNNKDNNFCESTITIQGQYESITAEKQEEEVQALHEILLRKLSSWSYRRLYALMQQNRELGDERHTLAEAYMLKQINAMSNGYYLKSREVQWIQGRWICVQDNVLAKTTHNDKDAAEWLLEAGR
jgi:hypothetical protein